MIIQVRRIIFISGLAMLTTLAMLAPLRPGAAAGSAVPPARDTHGSGDIPDTQAFVTFRSSTGGYALDVPEGWARTVNGAAVRFTAQLDGIRVGVVRAAAAPTTAGARAAVAAHGQSGTTVRVTQVTNVRLPAGGVVLVEYTSTSDPDPVTGKRVRLENNAYLFFNNGKLATLTLWAPAGADNADQWRRVARSFRWL